MATATFFVMSPLNYLIVVQLERFIPGAPPALQPALIPLPYTCIALRTISKSLLFSTAGNSLASVLKKTGISGSLSVFMVSTNFATNNALAGGTITDLKTQLDTR